MSKGRADIANFAIRAFLTQVGHRYDELRGFPPFKGAKKQIEQISAFFDGKCCYCGVPFLPDSQTKDHLIPLNKASCGLHAWGNVVPSCSSCNAKKHNRPWREYLRERHLDTSKMNSFASRIEDFVLHYRYDLEPAALSPIADNLYEDVGAVAMTLIDLRFKQASVAIRTMLSEECEQDRSGSSSLLRARAAAATK